MLLLVTSIARISSVFSSIPICILRHGRRLGPPVARQGIAPQYLRGGLAGIPLAFTLSFDPSAVHCPAVVCLQSMSIRIGQAGYSPHFR